MLAFTVTSVIQLFGGEKVPFIYCLPKRKNPFEAVRDSPPRPLKKGYEMCLFKYCEMRMEIRSAGYLSSAHD
jgi:hypothetical protein